MKKLFNISSSWIVTVILASLIVVVYISIHSYYSTNDLLLLLKPKTENVMVSYCTITIPEKFRILRKDYFDGTDSLNAVFLRSKDKFIVVSDMKKWGKELDHQYRDYFLSVFKELDDWDNYNYCGIEINGQNCLNYRFQHGDGWTSESFAIPLKGIYFSIYGINLDFEEALEYLDIMVYRGYEEFDWKFMEAPNFKNDLY